MFPDRRFSGWVCEIVGGWGWKMLAGYNDVSGCPPSPVDLVKIGALSHAIGPVVRFF